MFCRTTHPDKIVAMASILTLGGLLPLVGAYLSQVLLNLHPCHFCMLQRYPYVLVVLAGLALLRLPRMGLWWRLAVAVGICGLLATAALGAIHTGIEQHWLTYTGGCVPQAASDGSLEALRASILAAPIVACNEASFVMLGLSMASWNVLWAAFVMLLIALQYRYERRIYDSAH